MIEDIVNNKVCFGCGACEQTCAVKAIEMIPDSEGFLVPEVNEALCIKCLQESMPGYTSQGCQRSRKWCAFNRSKPRLLEY